MRNRIGMFVLLVVLGALALPTVAFREVADPQLRFGHYAFDVPPVDIYIDGELAVNGLALPATTGFVTIAAGTYDVIVVPTGADFDETLFGPADITLEAEQQYTIAAIGQQRDATFDVTLINETQILAEAGVGEADYATLFLNSYSLTDSINIDVEGQRAVNDLPYGEVAVYTHEAGVFELSATQADGTVIGTQPTVLFPGVSLVAVAGNSETVGFARSEADLRAGNLAFLRFLNTVGFNDVGTFNTLLALIERTGFDEELNAMDAYRIYAPNDAAFDALPEGALDDLTDDDILRILRYHILPGESVQANLDELLTFETLSGDDMNIIITEADGFIINDTAQRTNVFLVPNGLVSVIDAVLFPPED